jgi:hypothetical protein
VTPSQIRCPKNRQADLTDLTDSDSDSDFRLQTDIFNRLLHRDSDFRLQTSDRFNRFRFRFQADSQTFFSYSNIDQMFEG